MIQDAQNINQTNPSPLATRYSHLQFSDWGWSFEEKGLISEEK